jgi:predicted amidohydrolase YtcJ
MSSQSDFEQLIKTALDKNLPLQVHCNGDAAIDMLIVAARKAGVTAKDDRRIVVVHSNIQAMDQLDSYVELGLTPTYFSNHAYFWGDVHTMNFGKERASHISPMKTAKEKGLVFSNHTDFNITPLDPFFTLWTAMKRESRSGVIIGPQERINAYTALQALTTGPAWQFFEESSVGKLDVGMEASFVIMDKDPLKIAEVDDIRAIQIVETIKEGETIYASKRH